MSDANPVALRLHNLHKSYGDVIAVRGLDLEVRRGQCFGLLGPNGAGKTTTIEIGEGLTTADSGDVEVLGRRWDRDAAELRQRLGIQLQETLLTEKLTVLETIQLFRSFYHAGPPAEDAIEQVELGEKTTARVGALSGGQKQRLALACALVGQPELLLLDEPTTGLDPQARRQLWDLIERLRRDGRTIVLTTHYMDEAERLCDRVTIMDHGRAIAAGTPRELIASIGADHVVELSTSPLCEASVFEGLAGVRQVTTEDGTVRLQVTELHRAIPAGLGALGQQGTSLTELRTHSATLEDVFVALTGRHLRDD